MLTLLFLLWSLIRHIKKPQLPSATNTSNTMSFTPPPVEQTHNERSLTSPPLEESLNDPNMSPERTTFSPSPEPTDVLSEMSATRISTTDSYKSRYLRRSLWKNALLESYTKTFLIIMVTNSENKN